MGVDNTIPPDPHGDDPHGGDANSGGPRSAGPDSAGPSRMRRRAVIAAAVAAGAAGVAVPARALTAGSDPAAAPRPEAAPGTKPAPKATPAPRPLYVGTYTSNSSQGVGLATYDAQSGALTPAGTLAGVANPSFLALSGSHLYTVDEQSRGAVTAISIDAQGRLTVLGSQSTGGAGPCHVSVHSGGRHLLSANYDSGSIAVHPISSTGALQARTDLVQHTGSGPDPDRQGGPHAHMVLSDPQGGFVLAVDLGTDSVYTSRLNTTTGKLTAVSQARLTPGSGPRHLAFHPAGRYAYVATELGNSLVVCAYDPATGRLTPGRALPTVPPGTPASPRNYPAEVLVSPDGLYAYVSNRGHDSIARFSISGAGATPTFVDTVPAGGAYPRHISLDPSGTLLFSANQNSGTVTLFRRDTATGKLTATGTKLTTPTPVCVIAR